MSVIHRLILQKLGFHCNTQVISYADGVVLIVGFDRENETGIINSFVRAIEGKLAGMELKLNADKTQELLVSRKRSPKI